MKIEEAIKQGSAFKNEYQKLAVNLMYTASWMQGVHTRFFKTYDLSVQQYNILRILRGQKGNPIGIQSITERMIDKMSNSSRLVEKLRLKGLVDRSPSPKDRRQVEVVITQKGTELLKLIDKEMGDFNSLFETISCDEAKTINDLLDQLRTNE